MVKLLLHTLEDGTIYLVVTQINGSHESYKVGDQWEDWHPARSKALLLYHSYQQILGMHGVYWEELP